MTKEALGCLRGWEAEAAKAKKRHQVGMGPGGDNGRACRLGRASGTFEDLVRALGRHLRLALVLLSASARTDARGSNWPHTYTCTFGASHKCNIERTRMARSTQGCTLRQHVRACKHQRRDPWGGGREWIASGPSDSRKRASSGVSA
eukprot:2976664-Pleurochrysis_carterae.AAC.1